VLSNRTLNNIFVHTTSPLIYSYLIEQLLSTNNLFPDNIILHYTKYSTPLVFTIRTWRVKHPHTMCWALTHQ